MIGVISRFGVLGVFLLMVPESACVPVPSEVTLLFAGFAVHQGWMSFPLAVLAAAAGNLAGSLLAYGIGATGQLQRVALVRAVLARWESLLERHGTRAVFIARLLPLARTFVSLPAGARRVPLIPFIALTTAGCTLWALAFVFLGALAGSAWTTVDSLVGRVLLSGGLLLLAASVHRRRRRG
jgi:membrane protein DedA with SNARE-associated domain